MLLAASLTACTAGSSSSSTTSTSAATATIAAPSPSPSPSLSKAQQAASEAQAAYGRYLAAIDLVYGRGGSGARSAFEKVAAGPALVDVVEQAAEIQKVGWKQLRGVTTQSLKVDSVRFPKGQLAQVTLIACVDVRSRRAVDAKGRDVTRKVTTPFSKDFILVTNFVDKGWLVTQDESSEVKSC
jgi:hypothetical protein